VVRDALAPHEAQSGHVTRREIDFARRWAERAFAGSSDDWLDGWAHVGLPFSFRIGDADSDALLTSWERHCLPDSNGSRSATRWRDPASGMTVLWETRRYADFPAVEWLLSFENAGESESPTLSDVNALRLRLNSAGTPYIVGGANGGRSFADDMIPFARRLPGVDGSRVLDLGGDHPSSNRHLPFFNISTPEHRGVFVGAGWSGHWAARLAVEGSALTTTAGLLNARYTLRPGERVRTARVLLLWWEGEPLHAHNVWRRLLHEHVVPKPGGELMEPPVSVNVCFTHHGHGGFLHQATESTVSTLVEPFADLGAELFIIDAGWYDGEPWHEWLGNWRYSRSKYPRGFRPIADSLRDRDVTFGLWFAPENVSKDAPVLAEHPEWVRQHQPGQGGTFRMELPEARAWFLGEVEALIRDEGMACYRQDGSGWYDAEPENRRGMSETEHLTGIYAMWDALLERHPELVMEGCSGGGRRIDLETARRFRWHQKSDRWYDSESDQCSLYGANLFLPGGTINIPTERTDDYGAWSSFAGQFCLGWHPLDADFPWEQARRQIELYKRLRPRLRGDFYPLTPCALDAPYLGFQFHRTDTGEGFALVFRRRVEVAYPVPETFRAALRGLESDATYAVRLESDASESVATGSELGDGIELRLASVPSAELIVYEPA